ncbi:MAG: ATP-binding protein [Halobacteriovoraceae bacterium]|nr:ATP-binding protein [Halobacteriovoraceae bacterium]
MIQRELNPTKSNSYFLFGARGTGKTTFLKSHFPGNEALYLDLLDIGLFDELTLNPSRFGAIINTKENLNKIVIVDEIQKMPKLLDTIHKEIQANKRIFILTGSSSRRLKQQSSNLLAGRAWIYQLYPFTYFEIEKNFDLKKVLERGTLPESILAETNEDSREFLNAYTGTYLQKEIQQEQWVRKLTPFRKFLAIAAQMNGKIINKSKIAKDVGVDDVTIANYFEILEDTLIGFILPSYHKSIRKAQKQAPKFYFIDTGLKRALDKTLSVELLPQTSAWGDAFEHWFILEIIKNSSYQRLDWSFYFLRTKDDLEIDLIIERPGDHPILIEIKSKDIVREEDAKTLKLLGDDIEPNCTKWLVSNDSLERDFDGINAISWKKALTILFKQ